MTDFDRDDALDHLSSEELEAQAFGPDPDARRPLRGLVDRPASGAVSVRVKEKRRRWPKMVLGAAAALALLIAGVAIGVDMERTTPDAVLVPLEEADRARADAFEAAVEARADAAEARAEAMEAAADARVEAMEAAAEARDAAREIGR